MGVLKNSRGLVLLCFFLGFLVRLVPEVLSWPYPIGFDTVEWAARLKEGVVWYHWSQVFSRGWLLYALLFPFYGLVGGDPFVFMKLVAPVLYGLNVAGIYYFAKKALKWKVKRSLIAAFFFSFQLAALRISWDFYRNALGMAFLLFALPWIRSVETRRGFIVFSLLSLFVVFSHELASVVMIAVVLGVWIGDLRDGKGVMCLRTLWASLPALVSFLAIFYIGWVPLSSGGREVIEAFRPPTYSYGIFVNYLRVSSPYELYAGYLDLVSSVLSLFSLLFLVSLSLVLCGFFRDRMLDFWTLLLLVGSFSALVTPFFAILHWSRWMVLLVYPFAFYAANGVDVVLRLQVEGVNPGAGWTRLAKGLLFGVLLVNVLLASLFVSMPVDRGVFYSQNTCSYFPSTMLHNTLPLEDVEGVTKALGWLNEHATNDSCALIHHALRWWAELYLGKEHVIVHYVRSVSNALSVAKEHEFNVVYLIWWNIDIGWYNISVPENFTSVFDSGRISVFEYFDLPQT